MSEISTYPMRLPRSSKSAVEKLARDEGISMNQFVATAVAEKLAAISAATSIANARNHTAQLGNRNLHVVPIQNVPGPG